MFVRNFWFGLGCNHGVVAPIGIVATFASLSRVNRQGATVGNVLMQAIRSEAAGATYGMMGAGTAAKK